MWLSAAALLDLFQRRKFFLCILVFLGVLFFVVDAIIHAVFYTDPATKDKQVILLGGNAPDARKSFEIYHPEDKPEILTQQNLGNKLHAAFLTPRFGHVAGIFNQSHILIAAGYNKSMGEFLKSTEFMDPETSKFSPGPALETARFFAASVSYSEGFLLCGGIDDDRFLSSCEVLKAHEGRWVPFVSLEQRRSTFAMVKLGDTIFAIGGFDGVYRLNAVEKFDSEGGKWQNHVSLVEQRAGLACAVLEDNIFCCGGVQRPK